MGQGIIAGSGLAPVSMTAGNAAWGAWTSLFTPSEELSGFLLGLTFGSGSYGLFNVGIGSAPNIIISMGAYDGGLQAYTPIMLKVPAGQEIQVQLYSLSSANLVVNATLIPIPGGCAESYSTMQTLGTSLTSNFTSFRTAQTLLGTFLNMNVRKLIFVGGNGDTATSETPPRAWGKLQIRSLILSFLPALLPQLFTATKATTKPKNSVFVVAPCLLLSPIFYSVGTTMAPKIRLPKMIQVNTKQIKRLTHYFKVSRLKKSKGTDFFCLCPDCPFLRTKK